MPTHTEGDTIELDSWPELSQSTVHRVGSTRGQTNEPRERSDHVSRSSPTVVIARLQDDVAGLPGILVREDMIVRENERLRPPFDDATDRARCDPEMADGDPWLDRPMPLLKAIVSLDELSDEADVCFTLCQLDGSLNVRAAEQIRVLNTNSKAVVAGFLARRHAQGDRRLDAFHIRLATRRHPVGGDRFDVQPAPRFTRAGKRRLHFADRCEMRALPLSSARRDANRLSHGRRNPRTSPRVRLGPQDHIELRRTSTAGPESLNGGLAGETTSGRGAVAWPVLLPAPSLLPYHQTAPGCQGARGFTHEDRTRHPSTR